MQYLFTNPTLSSGGAISESEHYNDFVDRLVDEVCHTLGVNKKLLYTKTRETQVRCARWMTWEIVIAKKGLTLCAAGEIFGKHHHTSVGNALERLPVDLEHNKFMQVSYAGILNRLGIEEHEIIDFRNNRAKRKGQVTQRYLSEKLRKLKKANA